MSKEKQIELLEKQLAFWKHHAASLSKALDDAEETANLYAEMIDKTEEELNTERANRGWISADDRLPEPNKLVLCRWKRCENYSQYGFATYQYHGEWYVSNEGTPTVTHWMPLPEPPKEDIAEWVFDDADELGYSYKCSRCNRSVFTRNKSATKPSECPNCKAKMKGADNERY